MSLQEVTEGMRQRTAGKPPFGNRSELIDLGGRMREGSTPEGKPAE